MQQRHGVGGGHQRIRASSIGGGEAARIAAMHAAMTQGMTPKQAYESLGTSPNTQPPSLPSSPLFIAFCGRLRLHAVWCYLGALLDYHRLVWDLHVIMCCHA